MCKFEEGSKRPHTYLQSLAAKLSSNGEFAPNDTLTMETTFIRTPRPSCGKRKRYKPSAAAVLVIVKHSCVTINNKDNLCCTRAIVTMSARVDSGSANADYKKCNEEDPFKPTTPRNSIDKLGPLRASAVSANSNNFRQSCLFARLKHS